MNSTQKLPRNLFSLFGGIVLRKKHANGIGNPRTQTHSTLVRSPLFAAAAAAACFFLYTSSTLFFPSASNFYYLIASILRVIVQKGRTPVAFTLIPTPYFISLGFIWLDPFVLEFDGA
jgi:hypothetical protein